MTLEFLVKVWMVLSEDDVIDELKVFVEVGSFIFADGLIGSLFLEVGFLELIEDLFHFVLLLVVLLVH